MAVCLTYANIILDSYHLFYSYYNDIFIVDGEKLGIIISIADIFYYLGNVSIYITLIYRVYFTFKDSVYAISLKQLSFVVFILSLDIIAILVFVTFVSRFFENDRSSVTVILIVLSFDTINDILLNATLLYLFLSKLHAIICNLDRSGIRTNTQDLDLDDIYDESSKTMNNSKNDTELTKFVKNNSKAKAKAKAKQQRLEEIRTSKRAKKIAIQQTKFNTIGQSVMSDETYADFDYYQRMRDETEYLNEKQNDIVNLMTRVSILTITAAIFAQCFNIIAGYNGYRYALQDISDSELEIQAIIGYILRNIEGFINCFVLYLMFRFNEKEYFFCCLKCHKCLFRTCVKRFKVDIDSNQFAIEWQLGAN